MAKGRYARPPIHGVGITDVEHRVATDPIYKVWVKKLDDDRTLGLVTEDHKNA